MFFIYKQPGNPGIWMKDMNFAIDIIWVDTNKKVVEITRDVSPNTYPAVFHSQELIQYIVEVNAGWAEKNNITIGEQIAL